MKIEEKYEILKKFIEEIDKMPTHNRIPYHCLEDFYENYEDLANSYDKLKDQVWHILAEVTE